MFCWFGDVYYLAKIHGMNNVKFCVWLLIKSFATEHLNFFYVLLTAHLSIILVINQLNAQILVL